MKIEYKEKYNHIISFGCMCSCALFLEKYGFRDASYFFDWLTSNIFGNIEVIENDFAVVTNATFFKQEYDDYPHLVTHEKYGFIYTHVFDTKTTYVKQSKQVNKYISKRIQNIKNALLNNSLFVYYCRDKEEQKQIEKSANKILEFSQKYNVDILFIFNNEVSSSFPFKSFVIPYNNTHYPIGGDVSYPFEGGDTEEIVSWLTQRYDETLRNKNLQFKRKRNLFKAVIKYNLIIYKKK